MFDTGFAGHIQPALAGKWLFFRLEAVTNMDGKWSIGKNIEVEYVIRADAYGKVDAASVTIVDDRWKIAKDDGSVIPREGEEEKGKKGKGKGKPKNNEKKTEKPKEDPDKKEEEPPAKKARADGLTGLPPDWQNVTSKSSGKVYYYNAKTGVSQVEEPMFLPAGWQKMTSRSTGSVYYYNSKNGQSRTDVPTY